MPNGGLEHFDDGREAIGGAGGVRDYVVLGGIVGRVVHAQDDGDVLVLAGGRNDHLLDGAAQMLGGILGVGEAAGRFDHDLGAHAGPVDFGGVLGGENLDPLAVHHDGVGLGDHFPVQPAEHRIVLEQVRQRLGIGQIVGGDEFYVGVVQAGANDISSDAAEAVDAYFNCHGVLFFDLVVAQFFFYFGDHVAAVFHCQVLLQPAQRHSHHIAVVQARAKLL